MKLEEINVGSQSWASANLDTTYFQNGEKIPVVDNYSDWEKMASQGIPCCAYVKNKKNLLQIRVDLQWILFGGSGRNLS